MKQTRMKRTVALALATLCVFLLCACGDPNADFARQEIAPILQKHGIETFEIMRADENSIDVFSEKFDQLASADLLDLIKGVLSHMKKAENDGAVPFERLIYVSLFSLRDEEADRYFYISEETSGTRKATAKISGGEGINLLEPCLYFGRDRKGKSQLLLADSAAGTEEMSSGTYTAGTDESSSGTDTASIKDLNGHEFCILTTTDKDRLILYADDLNGDKRNDAAFQRNAFLQERYNCGISEETVKNVNDAARESLIAGEYVWDIIYAPVSDLEKLAGAGLLADLSKLEEIDLKKEWWNQNVSATTYALPAGTEFSDSAYAFAIPCTADIMEDTNGFYSGLEKAAYFLQAFASESRNFPPVAF